MKTQVRPRVPLVALLFQVTPKVRCKMEDTKIQN